MSDCAEYWYASGRYPLPPQSGHTLELDEEWLCEWLLELLELFMTLKEHGVTILFSTHITSDIEKCADDLVYISNGAIQAACSKQEFLEQYSEPGETLEEIFLRLEKEARA